MIFSIYFIPNCQIKIMYFFSVFLLFFTLLFVPHRKFAILVISFCNPKQTCQDIYTLFEVATFYVLHKLEDVIACVSAKVIHANIINLEAWMLFFSEWRAVPGIFTFLKLRLAQEVSCYFFWCSYRFNICQSNHVESSSFGT